MHTEDNYDAVVEESFPASDPPAGVIKVGPRPTPEEAVASERATPQKETAMPTDTPTRHDSERDRYILHLNNALAMEAALVDHLERRAESVAAPDVARRLRDHRDETVEHRETVREIIESLHGEATTTKAIVQPPITPGLLGKVMTAIESEKEDRALAEDCADFAVEHFEEAVYGALILIARNCGYPQHASRFEAIRTQERDMADFIAAHQAQAVREAFPPLAEAA